MDITLYKCSSENNRLDKTEFLKDSFTISGELRSSLNILSPSFNIQSENNLIGYNYCYIPYLNRYYYISSMELIRNNIYAIRCSVDVLMSYKDAILGLEASVARNEYEFDETLVDTELIVNKNIHDYAILLDNNEYFNTKNPLGDNFILHTVSIKRS